MSVRTSIGERLREAREARGLSLEEVSDALLIDRPHLEALERDASPQEFPEPLYARVFLREYARHVGLRTKALVDEHRAEHPGIESPTLRPAPRVERRPGLLKAGLTAGSVALVATLAIVSARGTSEPEAGTARAPMGPRPVGASPPAAERASPPPSPGRAPVDGVELGIRVTDGPCWIRVVRDGRTVLEGTRQPGFSRTFRADERIDLVLGNAGVVRVTLHGERVRGIGEPGTVYRASFVWDGGRVEIVPDAES